jgi:integrase
MPKRRGNGEGCILSKPTKSGLWRGYVSLGWGPNGKELRRWVSGRTRREVSEKLKVLLRDQQQGLPISGQATLVGAYMREWLENTARHSLAPATFQTYELHLRLHILPALGRYTLEELSAAHVQALVSYQAKRGLSTASIRYTRAVLSSALSQAVQWGLVARNVATLTKLPRSLTGPKKRAVLTAAEARTFVEAIKEHRLRAAYILLLTTGLRRGELCGLHWVDVDCEAGTLSVTTTLQRVGGALRLSTPKTKKSARVLYLSPIAIEALRAQRDLQRFEQKVAHDRWHETGLVFTTRRGTPIEPNNILRTLKGILRRSGLPPVVIHGLRHTYASLMLEQGVDLKHISESLGHSRIGTTADIYAHVYDAGRHKVADAAQELFGQSASESA